jgi:hypothetical protein
LTRLEQHPRASSSHYQQAVENELNIGAARRLLGVEVGHSMAVEEKCSSFATIHTTLPADYFERRLAAQYAFIRWPTAFR